jgi:hypothetical protein
LPTWHATVIGFGLEVSGRYWFLLVGSLAGARAPSAFSPKSEGRCNTTRDSHDGSKHVDNRQSGILLELNSKKKHKPRNGCSYD